MFKEATMQSNTKISQEALLSWIHNIVKLNIPFPLYWLLSSIISASDAISAVLYTRVYWFLEKLVYVAQRVHYLVLLEQRPWVRPRKRWCKTLKEDKFWSELGRHTQQECLETKNRSCPPWLTGEEEFLQKCGLCCVRGGCTSKEVHLACSPLTALKMGGFLYIVNYWE